jgi:molybdate transport system substrate-binding protein
VNSLRILSGGAAQGLVTRLAPALKSTTGFNLTGEFGAVGSMADKLRHGDPADIVILTTALIARLAEEKLVDPASITDIGLVETSLAVRSRDPKLTAQNADDLRRALLAADAVYVPDTSASTAGIHVAKVLQQLGIADQVGARLRIHPNGATAMRELAASGAMRPVGCTQSTEIISTEGVELSGPLPRGCELKTMYTAALTTSTANAPQAQALIKLLAGPDAKDLRRSAGFLDA